MSTTVRTPIVVVGADGSEEGDAALQWADNYAAATDASLRVITVWETPTLFGRPVPREGYEPAEAAREVMARSVTNLRRDPQRVEGLVPVGRPGHTLVDMSENADLLVVGRRGHRAASHLLLGSTSNYCLHHSKTPLVVVPTAVGRADPRRLSGAAPTVVVGLDGSPDSISGLRWAERHAITTGSNLHIVTVWEWPLSYGYPVVPPEYSPEADAKQIVERAVTDLSLPADRIETTTVEGGAGAELVRMSFGADLLVVGTEGHGAVGSVLLGSISNYCVHHATVPVVVVR